METRATENHSSWDPRDIGTDRITNFPRLCRATLVQPGVSGCTNIRRFLQDVATPRRKGSRKFTAWTLRIHFAETMDVDRSSSCAISLLPVCLHVYLFLSQRFSFSRALFLASLLHFPRVVRKYNVVLSFFRSVFFIIRPERRHGDARQEHARSETKKCSR